MAFTLPELPYAKDALAPHISAETLEFHHGTSDPVPLGDAVLATSETDAATPLP